MGVRAFTAPHSMRFRYLTAAVVAHGSADAMVTVALANTLFFGLPLDAARAGVGLYLLLCAAPVVVITPLLVRLLSGGAHHNPGRTMTVSAAVRAGAALLLVGATTRWLLFPVALLLLTASRVHGIARVMAVPDAVPPGRRLPWTNTCLAIAATASLAAGTAVGAGMSAVAGTAGNLALAAAVYAVGAVLALRTATAAVAGPRASDVRETDARDGSVSQAATVAALRATCGIRAMTGFLTFALAFATRDHTGLFLAVVVAAVVGGAAGTLAAAVWRTAAGAARVPPLLLLLLSCGCGITALQPAAGALVALAAAAGAAWSAAKIAIDVVMQRIPTVPERSRIITRWTVLMQLYWLGGAAVSVPPLDLEPGLSCVAVAGACLVLVQLVRRAIARPDLRGAVLHPNAGPPRNC